MNKIIRIFDINFIDADFNKIKSLLDKGGLLVLPAGPALATIKSDIQYYKSIKNADLVLFDSGYLCLLLRFLKKKQSIYQTMLHFESTNSDCVKKREKEKK